MATRKTSSKRTLQVTTLKHEEDSRKNIPTAEFQSVMRHEEQTPVQLRFARNPDLDPQLVWRGKDSADWSDLVVNAPPIYIQEKVHAKVLIDDLQRQSQQARSQKASQQQGFVADLFADAAKDFNGVPDGDAKTEFYQHDAHWSNRMILGDSLQVMASLAEREGLRGKVQCIYFDPPYGIRFNSNFQWSTNSRDVKDGKAEHITREPEMVKAFRDTWRDGIHSYLGYIRDRLTVARDLLTDSGSIFVQIGDENVHRVRAVMDEVFGDENIITQIAFKTTTGRAGNFLAEASNYLIWFAKCKDKCKYRPLFDDKLNAASTEQNYSFTMLDDGKILKKEEAKADTGRVFRFDNYTSSRSANENDLKSYFYQGKNKKPGKGTFKSDLVGTQRLDKANRLSGSTNGISLQYLRFFDDFPVVHLSNVWTDTGTGSGLNKIYVVQTNDKVIQRCMLMTTDPGDLVLDPTCGSGTTAYVAEQWGRRWITIDTSRVALALARARIMGARYPYYLLADSTEGQLKEAEVSGTHLKTHPTYGNVRQGFVYERVPHIPLKSIANNAEIDVIWQDHQTRLEPLRLQLNQLLKTQWEEWEIPREAASKWSAKAKVTHKAWWALRIERQQAIDASIAAKAEFEYLYDKPYEDKKKVRVAGPFTVESLLPHRTLGVDEDGQLIDQATEPSDGRRYARDYGQVILDNLRTAGVQQAHKDGKIDFSSLTGWAGEYICAEGRYQEGKHEKRAGIFIGPEFGTVSRADLVSAAREAGDANFDVLIACAFNYDAHCSEFSKLGRLPVLKARMNADLHMAEDLKNTGKGNLFVIFGEPDIELIHVGKQIHVKIRGVDVFHPNTGELRSDGADGIACWFIDTHYNEESFFVRHAYFLGANDPYKSLKTTLKAEIDANAWASLHSDTSRPFDKPKSGRIAVKVINHLGDEVMKVFKVK